MRKRIQVPQDPLESNMAQNCTCSSAPARKETRCGGTEDAPGRGDLETKTILLSPLAPYECADTNRGSLKPKIARWPRQQPEIQSGPTEIPKVHRASSLNLCH